MTLSFFPFVYRLRRENFVKREIALLKKNCLFGIGPTFEKKNGFIRLCEEMKKTLFE